MIFVIAMKLIFSIVLLCLCKPLIGQNKIFSNKKKFYYSAIFIQNGDTITKEEIIIEPFNRPWIFQARVQKSMKYHYDFDTIGLKNFIHYRSGIQTSREVYFERHNKVMTTPHWLYSPKKEITGYKEDSTSRFYIHPPRRNHYSITQLAPHPQVYYTALRDTACYYNSSMIWGQYIFKHKINVKPYEGSEFKRDERMWDIYSESTSTEYKENTLRAVFSKEIGFLNLSYKFYNNTELYIRLVRIEEKIKRKEIKVIYQK